ncbi:MAG: penicillin-binding protein 2 [Fimbriimonadaceae bacterium]|nr:penicillin-binding protein 2 [Fimbriimonadaceae bacterium]QYK59456.1 MAG: penicillin-binding protein 2 [Fimbriimonadaceae bacterium]
MSVIHAPEERSLDLRFVVVPTVLLLVFLLYGVRLWVLQVVMSEDLVAASESGGRAKIERLAPRGKIVDRAGRIVANIAPKACVTARPHEALRHPEAVKEVASWLGVKPEKLTAEIQAAAYAGELPAPVYIGVDSKIATRIAESAWRLPGFGVETLPMRSYAAPKELAHILGYVRKPRDVDVKRLKDQGVKPAEYVGIQGLEREYETTLMGQPGSERMVVDVKRRPVRSLGIDAPVPGKTLVLSIDLALQREALASLSGRRGSIVVLDPKTGEVLCMVSSPTFDASLFLRGISQDEFDRLRSDPSNPMFFRAAGAAYAPGSTFKIVTTLSAMRRGLFDPNRHARCTGSYRMGNRQFRCMGVHGDVAFVRAMAKSCNAYFADMAVRVGPDAIRETCDILGLGRKTGLDLPAEATGIVPTPEWWAKHRTRRFSIGDTVNLGVGQGELAVTPLQMACVMAMVANRGVSYQPKIARAIVSPQEDSKPESVRSQVLGEIQAPSSQWETLATSLGAVIESGTGAGARIPGLRWGGKTGSAENRKDKETHSWFVAMAPLDQPKYVVAVMAENAGHGGEVAAPIAGRIVRWLIQPRSPVVKVQSEPKTDISSSNLERSSSLPSLR